MASTSPVLASSTTAETFLAPESVLGLLNLLLDVELDVVVEGQLDRRAVDRVVPVAVTAGDDHAVGAAVIGDRAVGAGQHRRPSSPRDPAARDRPSRCRRRCWPPAIRPDTGAGPGVRNRPRGTCSMIALGDSGIDGARQIDEGVVALQLLQQGRWCPACCSAGPRPPVAISRSRCCGSGAVGFFGLGVGQLLADPGSAGRSARGPRW